jgi:pimeloyl-ACP methyl ester carboxylesterase
MSTCDTTPCPPPPPRDGPGAQTYPHAAVVVRHHTKGPFDTGAFVTYEPSSPSPERAPVVLFLHGFFDQEPTKVDPMLRHIAGKGFIVVYPGYGVPWDPATWEDHAVRAFDAAMADLDAADRVHPDRSRVAIVGHSIGGLLALRLATRAGADPRLPVPRTVVLLDAAGLATPAYRFLPVDDLASFPANASLLVVMAEESYLRRTKEESACRSGASAGDLDCNAFGIARRAFAALPQVARKTAVVIPSDADGDAKLVSDHNAILGDTLDAIDTWGYWRLTVAAISGAALGVSSEYAFGDTPQARGMGAFTDGRAVRPIYAIDECLTTGRCP